MRDANSPTGLDPAKVEKSKAQESLPSFGLGLTQSEEEEKMNVNASSSGGSKKQRRE
ncbi:hypothetical protein TSUD_153550 [Trifolium subterraneum]|uniref:Uncharacterized protein n=1 Tax=Trifolium subterraneum TaxID=3900 RepID=A0A2Z6ML53_TRISU|nr:hypothetical protein TSUD_153550 [Trifolium subterraneum]